MGQGSYVFCELDSIKKEFPDYQRAVGELESRVILKCDADWKPKTCGYLTPGAEQYGRTTIIPALFKDNAGVWMRHWRQLFTSEGHQTLMSGVKTGNTIPEGFKVAWMGLAFPNKQIHITELRWQISDSKYGRINIEELLGYNKPAIIFEKGYILNEEEAFELYGFVEGPIPTYHDGFSGIHQRIVPLGAAYYKVIDKVLGETGAEI